MSYKAKCRKELASALGADSQVRKIKGNIIVLRNQANGRERDWHRATRRVSLNVLPNWDVASERHGMIAFAPLFKRGVGHEG